MPTRDDIHEQNMAEIQALNQRGGRMLSIIDMITRGTIDMDMAAFLLKRIHDGASFLCCALQGGVGKTTLMGALLGLLPAGENIVTVTSAKDLVRLGMESGNGTRRSLVVHEIGSGSWYGYLWGRPVLEYLALKGNGTRIVSNIHADTLEEVEDQMKSFGGTRADALAFDLVLFIALDRGYFGEERKRVLHKVLAVTGEPGRRFVKEIDADVERRCDADGTRLHNARAFIQDLMDRGIQKFKDVARSAMEFFP